MAGNDQPDKVFNYFERYLGTLLKARGHNMQQIFANSEAVKKDNARKQRMGRVGIVDSGADSEESDPN